MRLCLLALAFVGCSTTPSASGDASANDVFADVAPEAGQPVANGTVSAWQTLAPMLNERANFCATVVGSYVVVIGGNYPDDAGGFVKLDTVEVARFHDDGSLEPWSVAGHAPSPVTECTATGTATTLYLLDGIYDDMTKQGHAFTAELGTAGTLGTFTDTGALPNGDDLFDDFAFATQDRIIATTSKLTDSCALLSAPLGALAPWNDVDWLPEFRGRPEWANAVTAGGTFVYVFGGYADADAGNAVLATGAGALVNDGMPGTSFPVTSLPTPTTFGTAASADDWVFVIGGRNAVFSATATATVISAQAGVDGTLGAWGSQPSLPAPRSNVCAIVAGSYLYVLGGADSSATNTAFAAQVRF
jgi:Kelch motif